MSNTIIFRGLLMRGKQGVMMVAALCAAFSIGFFGLQFFKEHNDMNLHKHSEFHTVVKQIPTTVAEIAALQERVINEVPKGLAALIEIPAQDRTFDNTARGLDTFANFAYVIPVRSLSVVAYVHPDPVMRDAAQAAMTNLEKLGVDWFSQNVELYHAFKSYAEGNALKENLTAEQRYFIAEAMKDFKHSGLDLPADKRERIKELEKELTDLSTQFELNISNENRTIAVTAQELAGIDQEFINGLKKNEQGLYLLGTDYPTHGEIMKHCSVRETRKKMFDLFANRAYPANIEILEKIIAKRDELAKIIGFESYAAYSINQEMAATVGRVDDFLQTLLDKSASKQQQEFNDLTKELPEGVTLSADGKMYPYDRGFVGEWYRKKHYDVDDRKVAEYFPMEKTVAGLLKIYEQFMGLTFEPVTVSGLWDKDVQVVHVIRNATNQSLGYLMLDMYPRPGKYTHACHMTIVPAHKGGDMPALSMVIANFPKSTATKPSLLKLSDVQTYFHEFGHALHAMLGQTDLYSAAGTSVKRDFVEMPSQMLEEWLSDREILKQLSSHYVTGESLPDAVIDKLLALKNFSSGDFLQRQAFLSILSLEYYKPGAQKDTTKIMQDLTKKIRTNAVFEPNDHFQAAFGHLPGYGARYYGYMWSKVFALDLFYKIKEHGLLDPVIGAKYVDTILVPGGSVDPNISLEKFLGRKPNSDAFFKDLGLE